MFLACPLAAGEPRQSVTSPGWWMRRFSFWLLCHVALSLCVSVSVPLLVRLPVIDLGPTVVQHDVILTSDICKGPISE